MKVRFYPKTEIVIGKLKDKLSGLSEECAELLEKKDKLTERSKVLFVPESDLRVAEAVLSAAEEERDELATTIMLLESHGPEEVMAEIDI